MNRQLLEFALRKQRLQFKSDQLRDQWCEHARGLAPALGVVDRIRSGFQWLRSHPQLVVGAGVALAVARPRALWRWFRRGVMAWQLWSKGQRWLSR